MKNAFERLRLGLKNEAANLMKSIVLEEGEELRFSNDINPYYNKRVYMLYSFVEEICNRLQESSTARELKDYRIALRLAQENWKDYIGGINSKMARSAIGNAR
jgi:hypothetical protein